MKFTKQKLSGLDGKTRAIFTEDSTKENRAPFVVIGDATGVHISGESPVLSTKADFMSFAKAVGDAAKEYELLKPKLARSLSGH
jgi:hypothetical protein